MRNWEIKSRSRFCSGCDQTFEVGQLYHTLLRLPGEEPERKDYCVRCWKEGDISGGREEKDTAYWQGRFRRLSDPAKKEENKKDVIERLLDRYIASGEESHINLCYILALLEERKKVLVPRETITDKEGHDVIVYEHTETGDTYLVRDPHLSLVQVEAVQEQVRELIDREKESAPGPDSEEGNGEEEDEEMDSSDK